MDGEEAVGTVLRVVEKKKKHSPLARSVTHSQRHFNAGERETFGSTRATIKSRLVMPLMKRSTQIASEGGGPSCIGAGWNFSPLQTRERWGEKK